MNGAGTVLEARPAEAAAKTEIDPGKNGATGAVTVPGAQAVVGRLPVAVDPHDLALHSLTPVEPACKVRGAKVEEVDPRG